MVVVSLELLFLFGSGTFPAPHGGVVGGSGGVAFTGGNGNGRFFSRIALI